VSRRLHKVPAKTAENINTQIHSPRVGSVPVDSISISHHLWAGLLTKYTHPQNHTHEYDHFHLQHHYSSLGHVYSSFFRRLSFIHICGSTRLMSGQVLRCPRSSVKCVWMSALRSIIVDCAAGETKKHTQSVFKGSF